MADLANHVWGFVSGLGLAKFFAFTAIFLVAEKFLPAQRGGPVKAIVFNVILALCYFTVNWFYGGALTEITNVIFGYTGTGLIDLRLDQGSLGVTILLALLWILLQDFFYYWFHRLQHAVPWMWSQHKLHHMDEHLNVSTSYRHHWLESAFRLPFVVVPFTILFNLDPPQGSALGLVWTAWGYFIHANLRLPLGPLSAVLVGPQTHRIHHSIRPEHRNKNFAASFPILDVIFGSYYHPNKDEFPETGVPGARDTTILEGLILPFRDWYAAVRAALAHQTGAAKKTTQGPP